MGGTPLARPFRALLHSHKFSCDLPAVACSKSFIDGQGSPKAFLRIFRNKQRNPVRMFVPSKITAITRKDSFKSKWSKCGLIDYFKTLSGTRSIWPPVCLPFDLFRHPIFEEREQKQKNQTLRHLLTAVDCVHEAGVSGIILIERSNPQKAQQGPTYRLCSILCYTIVGNYLNKPHYSE